MAREMEVVGVCWIEEFMMSEIFNLHFDRESYQDRHGELTALNSLLRRRGECSKTVLARMRRINEE